MNNREHIEKTITNIVENKDKILEGFAKLYKEDPEFARLSDEAHDAYVEAMRGPKIPKDWKYMAATTSKKAFGELLDIIGGEDEIAVVILSTYADGVTMRFTGFVSPKGIENTKIWLKEKKLASA